jgi:Thermostable hemolysin
MESLTSPTRRLRTSIAGVAREETGVRKLRLESLHVLPRNATVQRARVERFIERRYLDRFGSRIVEHYPILLSLQSDDGNVRATIGLRNASREPLFLERYFDEPVERMISHATGVTPARADILEIGNMASIGRTASARLIAASASYLSTSRYRYAVVTATEELRRMLGSFGFAWRALGAARADRLADHGRSWGSYYEQNPEILVGEIRQSSERMRSYIRATKMEVFR